MSKGNEIALSHEELFEHLQGFATTTWQGQGQDTFPVPHNPNPTIAYNEVTKFGEVFQVINPGGPNNSQTLNGIHYYTQLSNAETGKAMHQETGYYLFDADKGTFIKSIAIPRGISILAGGAYFITSIHNNLTINMTAEATNSSNEYGISNDTFLNGIAPTTSFKFNAILGSEFSYKENSVLNISGNNINHTDEATLTPVN